MRTICKRGGMVVFGLVAVVASLDSGFVRAQEFEGVEVTKPLSMGQFEERVKASFGFLSAREPELNQAEYAILEKFVPFMEEDPQFALEMVEGLTKNNKNLTASFDFILGNLYIQADRIEDAERAYKAAIEKYPDYLRAWRTLGLLYMNNDDIRNSLKALSRAIQLGDTDPLSFGQIGYCFFQQNEYLSALSAYTQAVLYDPENLEWMRGKVAALNALGDFQQANVILRDLVRREPENSAYWLELANSWLRMEKPAKAAACLEFVRGAGDETRASMAMLAELYLGQQMHEQSFEIYSAMMAKNMDPRASSLLRCARILHDANLGEKADALVARFLEMEPELQKDDEVALLRYRSRFLESVERYDEALEAIKEALAIISDDPESLLAIGRLHFNLGNESKALVALAEAERYPAAAVEAAVMQAQILAERQDFKKAETKLEEALLNGADVWVERYYEKIRLQSRKWELDQLANSAVLAN